MERDGDDGNGKEEEKEKKPVDTCQFDRPARTSASCQPWQDPQRRALERILLTRIGGLKVDQQQGRFC